MGGNVIIDKLVIESVAAKGQDSYTDKKGKAFLDRNSILLISGMPIYFAFVRLWQKIYVAADIYFPEYKMMGQQYDDLGQRLEHFWGGTERSMLLMGTPGMGKTSIVAYLAEHYKDDADMLFLRFRT